MINESPLSFSVSISFRAKSFESQAVLKPK
jgi:hypothetical protein